MNNVERVDASCRPPGTVSWIDYSGEVSITIRKDGINVDAFYFSHCGEYNNEIGPGFISWEELDKLRASA